MKNILYLITELETGGAEKILFDLSTSLDRKKYCVSVASLDGRGIYANKLRKKGIAVFDLKTYVNPVAAFFYLRKIIAEFKPDIIHTHLYHANIFGRIAAINTGIKVVSTCHIAERRNVPFRFIIDRLTRFLAEKEICVSAAVKNFQITKMGDKKNFYEIIHNGIDIEKYKPLPNKETFKQKYGLTDNRIVVGFLGRFDRQKGCDILLQALNSEKLSETDFSVIIGGYGEDKQLLINLAGKLSVGKRPIFAGIIDNPAEFLNCLDICVIPSRWEGFGLVAVEAMACGCAVIANDIDSLPEIINNNENGLLFPVENADTLAEKIVYLLTNPQVFDKIRASAISSAENFSLDKMIRKYENLYGTL